METSYVKEVKRNFRGNLLNYISFLEKEKSGSAQSTASLYKVTLGPVSYTHLTLPTN